MDSMNMGGEPGHSHGHGMYGCDGEPLMTEGGSWIGHFFPGLVFFIWGLHWLQVGGRWWGGGDRLPNKGGRRLEGCGCPWALHLTL